MEFIVYNQEIKNNPFILEFVFSTLGENLSHVYGNDMITPQSKNEWIKNNLLSSSTTWRIVIAYHNAIPCGFLIYTIKDEVLVINDIEIIKKFQGNPFVFRGLFLKAFQDKNKNWNKISGYINDKNELSQRNFIKLATNKIKTPRGVIIEIDKDTIIQKYFPKTN